MKRVAIGITAAALLLATAGRAHASTVSYFGEDLGINNSTRLSSHPNSDAARNQFFADLGLAGLSVGTENFEGFANDQAAPLGVNFGAVTATLTALPDDGNVTRILSPATNGAGRYPISGNQYWDTNGVFHLEFSQAITAFGFYGTDIGDFNGQVTLNVAGGAPQVITISNTKNGAGGSVIYFGFYVTTPGEAFTGITFGNTAVTTEEFGFDDFSIGALADIHDPTVPEPATVVMLGSGLALIALRLRKGGL